MSANKSFEASMERLEQIVRTMERGEIELEESLKLFQEGTELIRRCNKLLENAQLEVTKIINTPEGTPSEEEFPHEL